jgi:hypothetical protein|tara:strand:+ start:9626 stop:10363 length:738 start_codon:yes stop_codon:yes gene_type:complete
MIKLNFKNYKEKYLFFIALFLFLFWVFDSIVTLIFSTPLRLFWFCSLSLLIVAILILIKKSDILLGFLSVSLIFQGIWIIDILSWVFLGKNIFWTSSYLFLPEFPKMEIFSTMKHFFMIPLEFFAFIFMSKLPKNFYNVVLNIFLFSLGFLGLSLIFGPENNINYVYYLPFRFYSIFPNYLIFFLSYLLFVIVSGSLIGYLIYSIFKKHKRLFNLKSLKLYFWIILILCFIIALKIISFILDIRG